MEEMAQEIPSDIPHSGHSTTKLVIPLLVLPPPRKVVAVVTLFVSVVLALLVAVVAPFKVVVLTRHL